MLRLANQDELELVYRIVQTTIAEIYPHYYPKGAVEFFQEHHSKPHIAADIENHAVYLLYDGERPVATLTINDNEINRLFVLPAHQHRGYGTQLMDFAETEIAMHHPQAILCASHAAQEMYCKRGYTVDQFWKIPCHYGDFLCYFTMKKAL